MPACPACGKDLPGKFPFCPHCGAALSETPTSAGARERKVVSVLFCDLVGFTATSESADPEEVQARLAPYHARTRERIEAYGGTVEKFIGDAVMAVFGAPVAHEDDAERAVRAGLSVLEAIEELNEADPGLSLSVRIGVNTGEAVVSLDAHPERGEGMATGDVVNTAARIQAAAPVDGVAVGEATYQATERVFDYEELAGIVAKGKTEPVAIWRATAPRARFGSDVIRSMTTPLVGRELDLTLLRATFDRVANERSVQLITVVGEPGVGKSRLVAELFAYIDELEGLITWRQGRCLPYGEGITFWALGEIVKAHAGVYESDPPETAIAKLDAVLPEVDEEPWLKARLLPLLGIETGESVGQEEAFTAWRRFLESIAERDPAVFVFEDVHWADDALLAFLEHIADWALGVPLLIVCTARPELYESHPSWGAGLANQTSIRLSPLTDEDTARLVSGLLDQAVLPAETQQLLLERAGGNPLYAEEFVRMLRDRDLLDAHGGIRAGADVPFPDSIHALIAARVDTLAADRKRLLQDAAVMGKVFWAGSVAVMGDQDRRDVDVALHELSRKELVRPSRQSSMEGEAEYGFWHILVRDVAYGQIPRGERAQRHLKAADWLEAKAGERVEDLAEVLAYHTAEALELMQATGQPVENIAPRARRYALLAGERARGLDAERAIDLFGRALELTPNDDPARAAVLTSWGAQALSVGRVSDAMSALSEAVSLVRASDDREALLSVLLELERAKTDSGDPGWLAVVDEAGMIAGQLPPSAMVVDALGSLAMARITGGDYRAAIAAADEALGLAAELDLPPPTLALAARGGSLCTFGDAGGLVYGREALERDIAAGAGHRAATQYNNIGIDTFLFEGPKAALAIFEEGISFATQRGLTRALNTIRGSQVGYLVFAGRLDEAIRVADDLLPRVEESGDVWAAHEATVYRAFAAVERGEVDAVTAERIVRLVRERALADELGISGVAVACFLSAAHGDAAEVGALLEQLLERDALGDSSEYPFVLPAIVRAALTTGNPQIARELVRRVEPNLPIREHSRATAQALLAEAEGEYRAAADQFADAAERWERFGAGLEHAYALLGQGRCFLAIGSPAADGTLRDARALFETMGARPRIDECDTLIARASKLSS